MTDTALSAVVPLAERGGEPLRRVPMPGWPHFAVDEIRTAGEVLVSARVNYWTGEHGRHFEHEFARWAGMRRAVAVTNGTVALELALHALGLGPGDEVVVPAATFFATASAVVAVGATPVVVDVDPVSQCLTPGTVRPALTDRTAAILVVHLAGWPADTAGLVELARPYGIRVVEDCAQAHGARRDGRPIGTSGDIAAWSFCQDKIMTTAGEGGAVTTDDDTLWQRCWERKDHGKSLAAVTSDDHRPGFRWLHDSFGTNARMTEVQAAVGRLQLRKLPGWVARRRHLAGLLRKGLADLDTLRLPSPPPGVEHAWYRFWAHVRPERLAPGWDRDRAVAAIAAEGVPVSHGGCTEIHRERAFSGAGRVAGSTETAAELGRTSVVFPLHPTLRDEDVEDLVAAVRKVLAVATR